jgi:cell division septal protein FtsQ
MHKLIKRIKSLYQKTPKRRRRSLFWLQKIGKHISLDNSERTKFKKRKTQLSFNIDRFNKINVFNKNKKIYYIIGWCFLFISIVFIVFGPYFRVKNINILKKDNLTNINIAYKAIDSVRWKSIFSIKEKDIFDKLRIYQHNIKDIDISTRIPNNLKITLESYKGLFNTVINDKSYIITENGVLIPNKPDTALQNLQVFNSHKDEINKFIDYKEIFNPQYINNIATLTNKLKENIIDLNIKELSYYVTEREVHINTTNNLLLFSLDEDIYDQVEKTVIFHKQYHSLEKYGIYYSDLRIPNKVFYCPVSEEFRCIQNMKRIYE